MPILCCMPTVTAKKKCCTETPRCSRCPLVLARLVDAGLAERKDRRTYKIAKKLPKKVLAGARTR